MKTLRFIIILSILSFVFGLGACKKDSANPTGNAIFYTTSASAGGAFIDVEVNGAYQGRISNYVLAKPTDCNAVANAVIKVTGLEVGKTHTFKGTGQDGRKWEGTFSVVADNNQCWTVGFLN